MVKLTLEDQVELLMQGTEYGDEALKQAMAKELKDRLHEAQKEKRPLRVYCGFDPRTSDLHLGHTVPMRKMRQFQDLGHDVIFVIGRFTSLVGDPSDKDKVRAQLSLEQALQNAETYAEQAFRLLDPERTRIEYNDTWLSPLTFKDLIELAANFTIQQFLSRESFRKRWEAEDPIYLHEFFYALMQGYDAFHLKADVQIGGSDQLFNIVTAARKLMEVLGEKPNIAIILGILPGTDGVVKMSKSLGNHIPLNTTAEDMYGKVMSIPDSAMGDYFRLVTRWTPAEISAIEEELESGKLHPRDIKMRLAREILEVYYGEQAVEPAEAAFRQVFQEGEAPSEMLELHVETGSSVVDVMLKAGLVKSKSEARRLVKQRGVRLDDTVIEDPDGVLELVDGQIMRVGKRRFVRLFPGNGE
ncbi:MAG: tyrosine--tRNA ligase [Anaerolineales bacterium]|nr:tyrosine--tRNA ligase [Anaerolineales bacterium]